MILTSAKGTEFSFSEVPPILLPHLTLKHFVHWTMYEGRWRRIKLPCSNRYTKPKPRYVSQLIRHSAKGEPIRFKSLAHAERHINNLGL